MAEVLNPINFFRTSTEVTESRPEELDTATTAAVVTFFKANYSTLITTFLAYCVILGATTGLKGRSLFAFSAGSAAWTVLNGKAAFGLVASAPAVFALASMIFNWATARRTEVPRRRLILDQEPQQSIRQGRSRLPVPQEELSVVAQGVVTNMTTPVPKGRISDETLSSFNAAWTEARSRISPPMNPIYVETQGVALNPTSATTTPVVTVVDPDLDAAWEEAQRNKENADPQTAVVSKKEPAKASEKKEALQPEVVEARRTIWELAEITTDEQRRKFPSKIEICIRMILTNKAAFFNYIGLTPEQKITLLLPSVLTESQKDKIKDLDLNGRYQSVEYYQASFFDFLELTRQQRMQLQIPTPLSKL